MWEIYGQLNVLNFPPPYLDIHVPTLNNARIRIDIPQMGVDSGMDNMEDVLKKVTRVRLISQCVKVLAGVPGWKDLLIEGGVLDSEGNLLDNPEEKLGLAWRKGNRLDWVWADEDVMGHRRDWNVLVGAGPLYQVNFFSSVHSLC